MKVIKLTGPIHTWELFDRKRTFGEVTFTYEQAVKYTQAVVYNAFANKGQQRAIAPAHLRKIKTAMESGDYTPATASVSLTNRHRESLDLKDGYFSLSVNSDDPLLLTDGGHRMHSLATIVENLKEKLDKAKTDEDRERLSRWLQQALDVPVTFTVYLDGDAQRDFVNLQMGRPADSSHLLSMKIQKQLVKEPAAYTTAFEVAKRLNAEEPSPYKNMIRFDSRGMFPLPISTLCAKGSSDMGTSLLGLAKVGMATGVNNESSWLASSVTAVYQAIKKSDESSEDELFAWGKPLTPLHNGGTKGAAAMLIGLSVCLTYRTGLSGYGGPTEGGMSHLVESAREKLNIQVNGNLSGPTKRFLLGEFASQFFADLNVEKHHGIPIGLLTILSPSAFGVPPMPKRGRVYRRSQSETVESGRQSPVALSA